MFQKQHHRTYLVCVASSRPILLVRTSFHTVFSCDNNSVFITLHSEHQQIFWWDVSNSVLRHPVSCIVSAYLVSYCLLVRPQQRFITLHSEHQQLFWWDVSSKAPSAASMYTAVYTYVCRVFLGWDLAIFCTYVPRVCCVIPSYIVSAHLVSYCLLVRQ